LAVAVSSDFRKYDDGLRLTLDCTCEQIEAVEAILVAARARGEVNFGLHRQSHTLMTCFVPSGKPDSHLHFLDGMGGYAKAAEMMEATELPFAACEIRPNSESPFPSNLPMRQDRGFGIFEPVAT